MNNGYVRIYCGEGKGKSNAAFGRAIDCASEGKTVFIIQFMKGKYMGDKDYLKRFEPELKVFRFEKGTDYYENLSDTEKKEESKNMINGIHFAHKVLAVGECDVLVLDEVLGLVDLGIIDVQEVIRLIQMKGEDTEMILTGRHLDDELASYADYISQINILKDEIL